MNRILLLVSAFILMGCGGRTTTPVLSTLDQMPSPNIQLLGFNGCPFTPKMRENLRIALSTLDSESKFSEVDLESLPNRDPLLHWGAPTILINGRDLMGNSPNPSAAMSCRIYSDGLPNSKTIAARLQLAGWH